MSLASRNWRETSGLSGNGFWLKRCARGSAHAGVLWLTLAITMQLPPWPGLACELSSLCAATGLAAGEGAGPAAEGAGGPSAGPPRSAPPPPHAAPSSGASAGAAATCGRPRVRRVADAAKAAPRHLRAEAAGTALPLCPSAARLSVLEAPPLRAPLRPGGPSVLEAATGAEARGSMKRARQQRSALWGR